MYLPNGMGIHRPLPGCGDVLANPGLVCNVNFVFGEAMATPTRAATKPLVKVRKIGIAIAFNAALGDLVIISLQSADICGALLRRKSFAEQT